MPPKLRRHHVDRQKSTRSQAVDRAEGVMLLGSQSFPLFRPPDADRRARAGQRLVEANQRRAEFSRVRPREEGGRCIKKKTVLKFLRGHLGMNSAHQIVDFLGPGCDFQLVVLQAGEAHQASTLDVGLRKMTEVWQQHLQSRQSQCCGIVLCAGTHRVRTRLEFPVTIQGPENREASLAAAEWTIAGGYLGLKTLKVAPPDCIRLSLFHSLLKVRVGNLWISDCEFQAAGPRDGQLGRHCIKVHKAARVTAEHCSFRAADRAALDLRSHQVSIRECRFRDCMSAIDSWICCFKMFQVQVNFGQCSSETNFDHLRNRFSASSFRCFESVGGLAILQSVGR